MNLENSKSAQIFSKLKKPLSNLTINFSNLGLYALPEEYIDDNQVTELNYNFIFGDLKVDGGEIKHRQRTEEELWREEQMKLNKGKKKKKGEPPDPEVVEKEEYFAEVKRQDEERLQAMPEDVAFYDVQEDNFKNTFLVWEYKEPPVDPEAVAEEDGENGQQGATGGVGGGPQTRKASESPLHRLDEGEEEQEDIDPGFSIDLKADSLVEFEESVWSESSGVWIYLLRSSTLDEDSRIKARKKAKGQTGFVFNDCIFKAFLDLSPLQKEENKQILLRIPLIQDKNPEDYELDILTDCPQYNLEKAYLKVQVKLSQPLNPKIVDYQLQTKDIIAKPPIQHKLSKKEKVLIKFKKQLKKEIMNLTREYYDMYAKELEHNSIERAQVMKLSTDKRLEMRRKEFIERFRKSQKFVLLKERLVAHVNDIVNSCFHLKGDISGVQRNEDDRLFSDLYQIMLTCAKEAFNEQLDASLDESNGKIINSKKFMNKRVYKVISETVGEEKKARFLSLVDEYEMFGLQRLAVNRAKLLVDEGNTDVISRYCSVLLQSSKYSSAEEYIGKMILKTGGNKDSLVILALLFLNKEKVKEALIVMMNLLHIDPDDMSTNLLSYHVYNKMEEPELAERFLAVANRLALRKSGKIDWAKTEQIPPKGIGFKPDPLSEEESDAMWIDLSMKIIKLNFPNIARVFYEKIGNKEAIDAKLVEIELVIRDGEVIKAAKLLDQLSKVFQEDKKLLELYAKNQIELSRFKTAEKLLMKLISLRGNMGITLTRLGYLMIIRKRYKEARITFYRAVQLCKHSLMAWLGLGKACVLLEQYDDALEALKFANILDPLNPEVWLHIIQATLRDPAKNCQVILSFREFLKLNFLEVSETELLKDLALDFIQANKLDFCLSFLEKLKVFLDKETLSEPQKSFYIDIAEIFIELLRFGEAKEMIYRIQEIEISRRDDGEGDGKLLERIEEVNSKLKEQLGGQVEAGSIGTV